MKLGDLISLPVPVSVSKKHRTKWAKKDLEIVETQERKAVTVEGYIIFAKQAEKESCNCFINTDRDYHIQLAFSPDAKRSESVIMEITPRIRANHPSWRLRFLKKLAKQKTLIRVSGLLMLDPEHPDQVGRTRATMWEIHPILKIEIREINGWQEL